MIRRTRGGWDWELHLISVPSGHPRGLAGTEKEALERASEKFEQWIRAAGLRRCQ